MAILGTPFLSEKSRIYDFCFLFLFGLMLMDWLVLDKGFNMQTFLLAICMAALRPTMPFSRSSFMSATISQADIDRLNAGEDVEFQFSDTKVVLCPEKGHG